MRPTARARFFAISKTPSPSPLDPALHYQSTLLPVLAMTHLTNSEARIRGVVSSRIWTEHQSGVRGAVHTALPKGSLQMHKYLHLANWLGRRMKAILELEFDDRIHLTCKQSSNYFIDAG